LKKISVVCSVLVLGLSFVGHNGSAQAGGRPLPKLSLLALSQESTPSELDDGDVGTDVFGCNCPKPGKCC
jgi:hypothetical protein